MKRAAIAIVLFLAAFPVAAATPSHGPEGLRNLAVAPVVKITMGYAFQMRDGREVLAENKDSSGDIRRLQSALKEHPGDVRRMVELAELLHETADTNAMRSAWQDVERVCRVRLGDSAADGLLLIQLGEALDNLGRSEEAESEYRRAVLVSSNDWRCWSALGHHLQDRAISLLGFPAPLAVGVQLSPGATPHNLPDYRPSADAVQQSATTCREAGQCLNRVLTLAPKEPDAWIAAGSYACASNFMSYQIAQFKGERLTTLESNWAKVHLCPDGLADFKHAAELSRTNSALIAATSLFNASTLHILEANVTQDSLKQSVLQGIGQLKNLGAQPDKEAAAGALTALCYVQGMVGDTDGARASGREAVAADPNSDSAWEALLGASVGAVAADELVVLCESRVKQSDTPRNRLFLAKAFLRQGKPEKAAEQAEAILKIKPDNLAAYVVLGAADLKRSADPQFLEAAEEHVPRAVQLFAAMPPGEDSADRKREVILNTAILAGLHDDPEYKKAAKHLVEQFLQQTPDDETAKEILEALE
jgi:tetratricopeptide (TPR) repeat protein